MGYIHEPVESQDANATRVRYNKMSDSFRRQWSRSWLQAQGATRAPPTSVEMITPAGSVFLHVHDYFGHEQAAEEARQAAAAAQLERKQPAREALRRVSQVAVRKIAESFGADPEETVFPQLLALRTRLSDVWRVVRPGSDASDRSSGGDGLGESRSRRESRRRNSGDGLGERRSRRESRRSITGLALRRNSARSSSSRSSSSSGAEPVRGRRRRTTLQGLLEAHTAMEMNHTQTAEFAKAQATQSAKIVAERVEAELRCRRVWRQYGEHAAGVEAEVAKLNATAEAKYRYEQWLEAEERDRHLARAVRLQRANAGRVTKMPEAPRPINQLILRTSMERPTNGDSIDTRLKRGWAPQLTHTSPVATAVPVTGDDAAASAPMGTPARPTSPPASSAGASASADAPTTTPAALLFGDGAPLTPSSNLRSPARSSLRVGGASHRESVRPSRRSVRWRSSSAAGDEEGSGMSPYGPMTSATPTPAEVERRVRQAFRMHDHNDSGEMDAKELRVCLRSLGVPVDTTAGDAIVARYDADASGTISVDELRAIVSDLSELQEEYDHPNQFTSVGTVSDLPAPEASIATEVAVAQATEESLETSAHLRPRLSPEHRSPSEDSPPSSSPPNKKSGSRRHRKQRYSPPAAAAAPSTGGTGTSTGGLRPASPDLSA